MLVFHGFLAETMFVLDFLGPVVAVILALLGRIRHTEVTFIVLFLGSKHQQRESKNFECRSFQTLNCDYIHKCVTKLNSSTSFYLYLK